MLWLRTKGSAPNACALSLLHYALESCCAPTTALLSRLKCCCSSPSTPQAHRCWAPALRATSAAAGGQGLCWPPCLDRTSGPPLQVARM